MSPCPLSAYSGLLRPLAAWCLDTFGEGPPMLIGVVFGESNVVFQPVELDEHDPIDDLHTLAAPDPWEVLVIVVTTTQLGTRPSDGVVAHAIDRFGSAATELDEPCGRRRSLRSVGGPLHDASVALFRHCGGAAL